MIAVLLKADSAAAVILVEQASLMKTSIIEKAVETISRLTRDSHERNGRQLTLVRNGGIMAIVSFTTIDALRGCAPVEWAGGLAHSSNSGARLWTP